MGVQELASRLTKLRKTGEVYSAVMLNNTQCTVGGRTYPTKLTIPSYLYKGKKVYVVICDGTAVVVGD